MGFCITWNFKNKGLGREGPNWLGFKQVFIREITVLGHRLFLICLNAPRKPFLEGAVYDYEVVGHKLFQNHSCVFVSSAGLSRHSRWGLITGG